MKAGLGECHVTILTGESRPWCVSNCWLTQPRFESKPLAVLTSTLTLTKAGLHQSERLHFDRVQVTYHNLKSHISEKNALITVFFSGVYFSSLQP